MKEDELVPIRIKLIVDNSNFEDVFLWNKNEKEITPNQFSSIFCKDMNLPEEHQKNVENMIVHQIEHYKNVETKYLNFSKEKNLTQNLKIIKLNIKTENISCKDQFEWDVNNKDNCPESFSRSLCFDLGLTRECEVAISHSIREQILFHKEKSLEGNESVITRQIEWNGEISRFQQDENEWGPQINIKKKEDNVNRRLKRNLNDKSSKENERGAKLQGITKKMKNEDD